MKRNQWPFLLIFLLSVACTAPAKDMPTESPPTEALLKSTPQPPSSTNTPTLTYTPTSAFTPTVIPPPEEIVDDKGPVMRLVPAGEFTMGSEVGDTSAEPVHAVYLDAYYMDIYEVTNAQYAAFLSEMGNQTEGGVTWLDIEDVHSNISLYEGGYLAESKRADHPVIEVSWYGAAAYCVWRGASLPTEAQWEKAARGTDGRTFPWGEEIDKSFGNFHSNVSYVGVTTPVGTYELGISPYGIYDMAGNVKEWVSDWYDYYYNGLVYQNPVGSMTGTSRVVRGGYWANDIEDVKTSTRRFKSPETTSEAIGFRCVSLLPYDKYSHFDLPTSTTLPDELEFTANIFNDLFECDRPCFQDFHFGQTNTAETLELLNELELGDDINTFEYAKLSSYLISVTNRHGTIVFIHVFDRLDNIFISFIEIFPEITPNMMIEVFGNPDILEYVHLPSLIEIHMGYTEYSISLIYYIDVEFDAVALRSWVCQDSLGRLEYYQFTHDPQSSYSGVAGDYGPLEDYGLADEDMISFLRGEQECLDLD